MEPQDATEYKKIHRSENLIVLPEDNRGLVFSRNYILNYARSLGFKSIWMIDDDLRALYENVKGRTVKLPPESSNVVLSHAEALIRLQDNVGQGSLQYSQFGFGIKPDISLNTRCDVCVFIDLEKTNGIFYRPEFLLKEDRDFTMQIIASGLKTIRVNKYSFHCPTNGSNRGGLKPVYDLKLPEIESCQTMESTWGKEICTTYTRTNGGKLRYDVRINWKRLSVLST